MKIKENKKNLLCLVSGPKARHRLAGNGQRSFKVDRHFEEEKLRWLLWRLLLLAWFDSITTNWIVGTASFSETSVAVADDLLARWLDE